MNKLFIEADTGHGDPPPKKPPSEGSTAPEPAAPAQEPVPTEPK